MGVMTLADFKTEVQYVLGNRSDLSGFRLDRWINWAYFHVAMPNIFEHRALQLTGTNITLVAGTNTYDVLPTTLAYVTSVSYPTRRQPLGPTSIQWMDERDLTIQAQPSHYTMFGESSAGAGRMLIYPAPSTVEAGTTLTVRGVREPTPLSSNADKTELRYVWDEVITLGAVWRGWRDLGMPQQVEARETFAAMIREVGEPNKFEAGEDRRSFQVNIQGYQRQ